MPVGAAPSRERDGGARFQLQRRAPRNLRKHTVRALTRFLVLLVADLAALWLVRAIIRAVRDDAAAGQTVASALRQVIPRGSLDGWQLAAAFVLALFVLRNYGTGDRRRDPRRLVAASALGTALQLWNALWQRAALGVFAEYVVLTGLLAGMLVCERFLVNWVTAVVRRRTGRPVRTLFVGPYAECRRLAGKPAFIRDREFFGVGAVDVSPEPHPDALGSLDDLAAIISDHHVEAVVACGYLNDRSFQALVDTALSSGCQLLAVPRATQMGRVDPHLVRKYDVSLMELTAPSLRGQQLVLKRAIDLVSSGLGLAVLSPLLALIAAVVKLDSPGPAFFTQERVGRGGRRFRIVKFRTMVDGAHAGRDALLDASIYPDARLFKVPADPRMTRVGRWLRRTSLDELPQLVNVLWGEMSLVGPRPPLPSEVALYEEHHYARFDVKPGITGPWQVAGRNEIAHFEDVIALEVDYIRNWSLRSDLSILVRTGPAVLRMRGAH